MGKLFDFGNRYARESTWKDFALVKFCLFSMGLAAGTQIPEKHKKKAIGAAACVFAATYIPLMSKVIRLAFRRACRNDESIDLRRQAPPIDVTKRHAKCRSTFQRIV